MKFSKYILGTAALFCTTGVATTATAQDVKIKCLEWNIKSFEYDDNSNALLFEIDDMMNVVKAEAPDLICFNEFETATGRMSSVEKLTECAQYLGMFPFFVYSYVKAEGFYGNGILSKYPIIDSGSIRLGMYDGADQRSAGWVDILVPTDAHPEGVKVRFVATHLDAFGGDATCLGQAKELIAQIIEPAVAAGIPCLLMGDLNTYINSATLVECQKTGVRLCNDTGTFGGGTKLDYYLGYPKAKWSCPDYKVIKGGNLSTFSDHSPIIGTAVLKN